MDRMDAIRNAEAWVRESPGRSVSIRIGSANKTDFFDIYAHDYENNVGVHSETGLINLDLDAAELRLKEKERAIEAARELLAALEAEN